MSTYAFYGRNEFVSMAVGKDNWDLLDPISFLLLVEFNSIQLFGVNWYNYRK